MAKRAEVWVFGKYGKIDEDALAAEAERMGGGRTGSGTCLESMVRDVSFIFPYKPLAAGFAKWAKKQSGVDRVE